MSENKTLYTSNDLSLNQAHSYTLLLQVEVNSFSYAIVHGKQLLAWGENFNTDELRDPDQLRDILTANYKDVLIGLDAEAATLLPKSLYEPGRVNDIARLLDVKDNEKVFSQLLDDDNVIIYKADETLTYAVKDLDNQYVFHKDAGFIKAIPNDYPTSSNLYLNIGHDKVSIVNYKYNKLRFHNTFSIKNHEELAYFCALVAKELQLEPKDMRLVLSGEINDTDGYFNYLKDFFGQVRLSSITILDAPYDVQSQKVVKYSRPVAMRIIGGKLKGLRLNPPKNLPVRPTTDLAKEALFNILQNQIEFEGITVLDLFSGTGNISMEFASRYAEKVTSVDRSMHCVGYLKDAARQHGLTQIETFKADVFKYLAMETEQYDLIFADPPYDLDKIPTISKIVFDRNLLKPDGLLIVEHQSMQNLANHPAFVEQRKYGHSSFSFFKHPTDEQ